MYIGKFIHKSYIYIENIILYIKVIAPLGGLPSRVPQHRKSLSLLARLLRIFTDFYRMASAPARNADTIRSFETGSENRSGASGD